MSSIPALGAYEAAMKAMSLFGSKRNSRARMTGGHKKRLEELPAFQRTHIEQALENYWYGKAGAR
jgi:hypothetical protein